MRTLEQISRPRKFAGLGCVALLLAGGSPARADNIDTELFNKALLIMKDLEAHGYKNVGILKFLVKQGNGDPTLAAGKLTRVTRKAGAIQSI